MNSERWKEHPNCPLPQSQYPLTKPNRVARPEREIAMNNTIRATNEFDGCEITRLTYHRKPAPDPSPSAVDDLAVPWLPPPKIADELGVSPQRVGGTITKLGLRGSIAGLGCAVESKSAGPQRTVTSYVYPPRAVPKIADQWANYGPFPPRGCGNDHGKIVPLRPLLN